MPDNLKARRSKFKAAAKQTASGSSDAPRVKKGGFGSGRVSRAMKTLFSVQFSTLQDAGLPVLRSLKILSGQMPEGRFKNIIAAIEEDVEGGSPLSEAFAKHPKVFDDLYVNMVKAGEAGGILTEVFQKLAEFMERSDKLIRQVRGALMYPAFIVLFAGAVLSFIMIVIIPQFEDIFDEFGKDLPAATMLLMDTSDFISTNWWCLPLIPILAVAIWRLIRRSEGGLLFTDGLKLRVPLFGKLIKKTQVARFARTLGTLSSSGVPLLDSLAIVQGASANAVLRRTVGRVAESVSEGESIAQPLAESGVFDDMVVNMVDVGEETGELDRMLEKIADRFDGEVDITVSALLSILEPILIVIMGGIVGFIVIALFLPLLELQSTL